MKLSFDKASKTVENTVFIGKGEILRRMVTQHLSEEDTQTDIVDSVLQTIDENDGGSSQSFFLPSTNAGNMKKVTICTLPDKVSRNNHPLSLHKITTFVKSAVGKTKKKKASTAATTLIKVGGVDRSAPVAAAIARAFPMYNRKTSSTNANAEEEAEAGADVIFSCLDADLKECRSPDSESAVAEGVRLACRLVDTTPEELTTEAFADECRQVANQFADSGVTMTEIAGEELLEKGYGGIYGVGKAAVCPPRLVILEYEPASGESKETVALVGKGIVYDTGGLSIKTKTGMPGMKHDMGGAAGLLGGFVAAVRLQVDRKVKLVLCLAENAIGPAAVRNDDILTLYSGKTVEINNSDAEGRLVLGDGVAHATKHFEDCDLIMDMATLTGAQLVATGKTHAGILANSIELEQRVVKAGLLSGDLVFPLLYAPELLKVEFKSAVADMKNSVKDRGNAQSSCAGHFIESHLCPDYKGGWVHVDMAGPASKDERGTGYGVALVLAMLEAPGFREV